MLTNRGSDFMLADAARCGSDAARYGADCMLTDAARCGSDAARRGSDFMLNDPVRCGSDAARCGSDFTLASIGSASCDSEYIEDNAGGAPACAESNRYGLKGDIPPSAALVEAEHKLRTQSEPTRPRFRPCPFPPAR